MMEIPGLTEICIRFTRTGGRRTTGSGTSPRAAAHAMRMPLLRESLGNKSAGFLPKRFPQRLIHRPGHRTAMAVEKPPYNCPKLDTIKHNV